MCGEHSSGGAGGQADNVVRAIWHGVVGKAMGDIDVRNPNTKHAGKVKQWPRYKLAGYISKYIDGGVGDSELNAMRYWPARHIEVEEPAMVQFAPMDETLRFAFDWLSDSATISVC